MTAAGRGRVKNQGHRSRSGVKVEVRVSKDGNGVGSTSILDRKQLVGGVAYWLASSSHERS